MWLLNWIKLTKSDPILEFRPSKCSWYENAVQFNWIKIYIHTQSPAFEHWMPLLIIYALRQYYQNSMLCIINETNDWTLSVCVLFIRTNKINLQTNNKKKTTTEK